MTVRAPVDAMAADRRPAEIVTGARAAASHPVQPVRHMPARLDTQARRPAIAVVIPSRRGPSVILDAGANADAKPENLVQFGHMGSVFAEEILGIASPEVRLLSIGEEREKGNQLTLEAHDLLAEAGLNFKGNT